MTDRIEEIREMVKAYGGRFHGPRIEHLSMEERAFFSFVGELDRQKQATIQTKDAEIEKLKMALLEAMQQRRRDLDEMESILNPMGRKS